MSPAVRKRRRAERTQEVKHLCNLIRRGVYPRYFFAKQEEGKNQLERDKKGKLTWRQIGTFKALMALPEVKQNVVQDQPSSPARTPESA